MPRLSLRTPTARRKLKPRTSAYSEPVSKGVALLYRTGARTGRWYARTPQAGMRVLADADDRQDADGASVLSYEQAMDRVRAEWRQETEPQRPASERSADLTVGAAWQLYEDNARLTKSGHGLATIRSYRKLILSAFGTRRLDSLTVEELTAWRNGLVTETRGQSTANKTLAALKAALNATGRAGAWQTVKKFAKADGTRDAVFNADECGRLVAAAYEIDRHFGELIEALALTGARYGELVTARCSDLGKTVLQIRAGKTGPRSAVLSPKTAALLHRIKGDRDGDDLLFLQATGQPWVAGSIRKRFARALELADLDRTATPYALRHSCITKMLYAGVPASVVARNVGTSLEMLDKTYSKVIAEMSADALKRFDD